MGNEQQNNNSNGSPEQSHGDTQQNPPAQGATSTSHGEQSSTPTLEELQRKLSELERDNKKYRTERKQQEETLAAAAEARLKEQGEYKQLAEQREARLQQLEPVQSRYSELSQLVASQIEAQIKEWPAEIKVFDPGTDAPIESRLTWLEKSKPLIDKLALQARGQQPGNGPNPRPTQSTPDDARNQYMQKLRSSGKYGA